MNPEPIPGYGDGKRPTSEVVAQYDAVVVARRVIWSDLSLRPAAETARAVLLLAPPYVPKWPPRPATSLALGDDASADLLALTRLKALFDFGSQLPDEDVGDVLRNVEARWPAVPERISVDAVVRANGDAEWGYERAPGTDVGRADDEFANTMSVSGRSELDLYVQNLVRADLEERLTRFL